MEDRTILDSQISASSVFAGNYAAQQARLHFKAGGGKTGGWSAQTNDDNQWLQVDLQQTTRITRIATQGRNGYTPGQWVTQYKLQYGEDVHTFKFYRNGDHSYTVWFNSFWSGFSFDVAPHLSIFLFLDVSNTAFIMSEIGKKQM